jgi:hypothetical protein
MPAPYNTTTTADDIMQDMHEKTVQNNRATYVEKITILELNRKI